MNVIIGGGGIGGLSAAYFLRKLSPTVKITLLESSSRLGGWIESSKLAGPNFVLEKGPHSIRSFGPAAQHTLKLIQDLGLENEILPITKSHPASTKRYILYSGELTLLPSSLSDLFKFSKNGPFNKPLILPILSDLFKSKKSCDDDSVYNFVSRRFSKKMADFLIDPFVRGICAGDARKISAKAFVTSTLFQYEQDYGSVLLGLALGKKGPIDPLQADLVKNDLVQRSIREKWNICSLKGGLENLIKALQNELKNEIELKTNEGIQSIQDNGNNLGITSTNGTNYKADRIILTTPAYSSSEVLKSWMPEVAFELARIRFNNVGVVNVITSQTADQPEAFGYLVPSKEKTSKVLGVIYDSVPFPCGSSKYLYTIMASPDQFSSIPELEKLALDELQARSLLKDEPQFVSGVMQHQCIPQYELGHSDLVANARKLVENKSSRRLWLSGSSYDGVGVNDTILSSKRAVYKVIES